MSSTEIGIRCGLAAVAFWIAYHPQSRPYRALERFGQQLAMWFRGF